MGKGLDGGEVSFTTTLAPITATTQWHWHRERERDSQALWLAITCFRSVRCMYCQAPHRIRMHGPDRSSPVAVAESVDHAVRQLKTVGEHVLSHRRNCFFFWHFSFISISRWPLSFLKKFPWTCMWRLNRKDVGTARHVGSRSEARWGSPAMHERSVPICRQWLALLRRRIEALTDCLRLKNAYCCADSMFF